MSEFEQYKHHDAIVWVRKDLKDKHRDHCLCHSCVKFSQDREFNCLRSNHIYSLCNMLDMVTPVWECPSFEPIEE